MRKSDKLLIGWFGFLALVALSANYLDDKHDPQLYHCDMVALWAEDEQLGYGPHDRRGWPDYKEVCTNDN